MNRQILGMLAVTLTAAIVQPSPGQAPPYPSPVPYATGPMYPTQPAVYMNTNPYASGVYPAMTAPMPQGAVQLASCPTCEPAPAYGGPMPAYGGELPTYGGELPAYGGEMVYGGANPMPNGGDWDGSCDGDCADGSGGLLGGCGGLFGGGGLFGCGGMLHRGGCGDAACSGSGHGGSGCGCFDNCFGGAGCCLPRWFDVHTEWLYWKRDYDDSLQFSSTGILGPDALNANQLDFSEQSGFRITGAYLLGVASAVEVSYFGSLNWASGAQASSPEGALFSVFSDFGSNPLNGFPETDFGNLHQISLSSELNNAEINLRHRWVTANCVLHNSILVGARYFRLREDLVYDTRTALAAMDYRVKTDNDLIGAQIGGDSFICVTPRLKIGGEVEGGIYGTSSSQRTNMTTTDGPSLREYNHDNDIAFLGEAGVMALFRATSQLTLRIGYQVMYVDGVALAVQNFNTASPFSARDSFLDNSGDVFYHGATLGFEWTH